MITRNFTVADPPLAVTVPALTLTAVPVNVPASSSAASVSAPALSVMLAGTYAVFTGMLSLSATAVASAPPELVTTIVYSMVAPGIALRFAPVLLMGSLMTAADFTTLSVAALMLYWL